MVTNNVTLKVAQSFKVIRLLLCSVYFEEPPALRGFLGYVLNNQQKWIWQWQQDSGQNDELF